MSDVEMPQLGETVTEGTITKWFKAVGDAVEIDEPLFEVSTDKVDSEVPSPVGGVLTEIVVPEGETVEVGTRLAVVSDEGDGPAPAPATEAESEAEPEPEDTSTTTPAPEAAPEPEPTPAPEPTPTPEPAPAAADGGGGSSVVLSPIVRRLMRRHGLEADQVTGTGVGGRITRNDVLQVVEGGGASASPAPTASTAPPEGASPRPARARKDQRVALSNIRRRTAEHMVQSKATSPHVLTAMEVDFERIEVVRRSHGPEWKAAEGFSLTYLPFIARAVVDAVEAYPHINATVDGDELVTHAAVNLGIAVDLDFEGLLAPVVGAAETKRLRAIARDIRDLADRARTKKLGADEITGGTFTLTNPGQYGTMMQFPIINQPQVAILSTDGVHRKPVVVTDDDGGEAIAVHSVGVLALAWDHRAFDGAYAAAFLDEVRSILETRDWEAEL